MDNSGAMDTLCAPVHRRASLSPRGGVLAWSDGSRQGVAAIVHGAGTSINGMGRDRRGNILLAQRRSVASSAGALLWAVLPAREVGDECCPGSYGVARSDRPFRCYTAHRVLPGGLPHHVMGSRYLKNRLPNPAAACGFPRPGTDFE